MNQWSFNVNDMKKRLFYMFGFQKFCFSEINFCIYEANKKKQLQKKLFFLVWTAKQSQQKKTNACSVFAFLSNKSKNNRSPVLALVFFEQVTKKLFRAKLLFSLFFSFSRKQSSNRQIVFFLNRSYRTILK